jgi:hypothetical protein
MAVTSTAAQEASIAHDAPLGRSSTEHPPAPDAQRAHARRQTPARASRTATDDEILGLDHAAHVPQGNEPVIPPALRNEGSRARNVSRLSILYSTRASCRSFSSNFVAASFGEPVMNSVFFVFCGT